MLLERYRGAVDSLLEKVRNTQTEAIEKCGKLFAETVANGGCIHLGKICHEIEHDLIYRGGGPIFYKAFKWNLNVENPVRARDRSGVDQNTEGLAAYALKASGVLPGDVIVVSSVSGRTLSVVDLAWEAKKMGVKVVALISMEYATQVDAVHSSGKKLYEFVDIVLDNCAPAAEAMLEVEGIEARFAAASGIASDYIMWSVTSVCVEEMLKMGLTPGILKSANFPGGNDYNKTVVEPHYDEYGW